MNVRTVKALNMPVAWRNSSPPALLAERPQTFNLVPTRSLHRRSIGHGLHGPTGNLKLCFGTKGNLKLNTISAAKTLNRHEKAAPL
jgi:hypothetical protein